MSSQPPNQKPILRTTGDGSLFLNRVQQAATKTVADATQQRSATIGSANTSAAATLAQAQQTAADILRPKPEAFYALTDQGLFRSDLNGKCNPPVELGLGAVNFVIDLGAQRIYWSERRSFNSGGSSPAQIDGIALYPAPSFQGQPYTLVAPMSFPSASWAYSEAINFDFGGQPGFPVRSLKLGPDTLLTLYEHYDREFGFGRVRMIFNDDPNFENDWPLDKTTAFSLTRFYHCLMSANLDGTDKKQLATLPQFNTYTPNSGALALDSDRGLLFWMTPSGHVMKLDLGGAPPIVLQTVYGLVSGVLGLAIDSAHQTLYWSEPEVYGTLPYGDYLPYGPGQRTLTSAASQILPPFPFGLPQDWGSYGKPPVEIAVDGVNDRMYCCNGQQIWRAGLDGAPLPGDAMRPTPKQLLGFRIYGYLNSIWGLTLDQRTQTLYWLTGNDLMQAQVDPSLSQHDIIQSVKTVFSFEGLTGDVLDFGLLEPATVEEAKRAVQEAHGRYQQAQTQASQSIADAHTAAAATRQKAQDTLNQNQITAAANIAQENATAAQKRKDAQSAAQQKRDEAAARVNDANADSDRQQADATRKAKNNISNKQAEADGIRSPAQSQLDQARQKLQST
jgi:hypothetical protein